MAGEYDGISVVGKTPTSGDYDAIDITGASRLRANVGTVFDVNPDEVARKRRLAEYLGYRPAAGTILPDADVRREAAVKTVEQNVQGAPALRQQYTDEEFAALGHDNSFNLSQIEKGIQALLYPTPKNNFRAELKSLPGALASGAPAMGAGMYGLAAFGAGSLGATGAESFMLDQAQQSADVAKRWQGVFGQSKNNDVRAVGSGLQSAGQALMLSPLAIFGGPAGVRAMLGIMAATQGGQTYTEDRTFDFNKAVPQRQSVFTAGVHGIADATAEYMGERYFGAGGFFERVAAGATAGKLLIYEIAKELPGEIATTLVQNFNKWVLTEPDKSVKDFLLEQPDAIRQTAIATVVGGGTQIGVVKTAEAVIGRHIEHQARANAAAQNAEVIKHIMGLAEADVLRERSPETFAQFMQAAAEHGPISDVYIDVHTLAETLGNKIEDVKALVPSIGAQFDQAMAEGPGSQIRIPVSEFATNLAGEAYAQPLIEHLRAGEDAMSAAEAKVYMKKQGNRIKEEIAKVMKEKQNDDAFKASRDAVQAETLAKFNAAGRYTAAVNEKLATLHANVYSVFAAKLGMMPEQFAKEYEVQIKHEEGAATYNKEALLKPGELTVEGYHFSKEQRPSLTTRMFGTGLKGSNQEVFKNATDKRLRNRLYFYVDKGTGINPEAGVGAYGHKAKLSNIYDANSDPLRLRKGGQEAFESAVLDRGFAGYLDRLDGTQSGHVVLLGDQSITPEALGPLSKTTGEVVPPPAARASEGRDKIVDALQANKNLPMGAPPISMWRNLLKGEIADALEKAGVFDGDQSRTMYKSELIRAFEKATEDPNALKPAHGAGVFFRAKDTGRILLVKRADNVSQPRTWNLVSGAIEKGETPEQAAMREAKEEIGYTGGGNPRFVGQTSHEGVVFNSYVVDVPNEFVPTLNEENTGHGWYDPGALPDDLHPGVSRLMDAQEKALGQDYDQAARIKTGPELFTDVINKLGLTPQEVAATALEFMTGLPGDMAFFTPHGAHDMGVPEVVQFLDARRKASGLPVLDISKPEDRAQLARLVAAEALAAIKSAGASLEWYDQTIRSMLDTVALQHPELKSDPHARNVFLIATAITSQGLNPVGNLKFARAQYEEFTKTGKFPEVGQGDSGEAMAKNFVKANKLMAAFTPKELADFLVTEFTVKELSTIGFEVSGESMGTKVLGSAVFGPKIGFGFYSNLNGNFEPVTMDMWFMRTFGRLAGTLPDFDPKRYAGQLARFREGLRERGNKRGLYARDFDPEMVAKALVDDDAALALARVVNSVHQKDFRDNRAKFDRGTREKSTIVAASVTMIQSMDKPKDVPSTGTERNHMRDVVTQVVDLVQQHYGTRVPPAALQALIWYPEQELYSELGVKLRVTSTDYADAARGLMKEAGFSDADIDAAAGIRATTQPGPTGVRPSSGQGNASANGQAGRGISGAVPLQGEQRTAAIAKHQAERTFFQSSNAGHTVNIGLDIPGGGTLSVDEVLAALTAAGVKVGQHAVHKSNTEQTVVASLDRALTPEEAHALSVALKQEAIAQMSNGQGELYGPQAENWRPFNPEYFLRMDGSRANTAVLEQPKRGSITFGTDITKQASVVRLLEDSDLSTYLHESGHLYLEIMSNLAGRIEAKIAAGEQVSDGEKSIVDDMRTVLDWMGVKATPELTAIERWVLMPLEEKTTHHEMWARGFELYAFEGKSPSLALRDIFRTFRAWLAQVYRSHTDTSMAQTLRVNLSPEVRQVMDRMVATTEDIQEAEAARDMGPLFKTAEEAGMSPEEWHAYHDLGVNATQSAIEDLQARSLRDMQWASRARSRKLKELQALHDDLRKATELEVTADVMSQPVYRAWAFLTSTVDPVLPGVEEVGNIEPEARSAKLRTSFVKEISETIWKVLSDRHMTSDVTGVDPDQIAPLFGFDSGDMLVHNLANAEDPKTVIEGITDRLMLERHGELATPQAMAQAADEAVHDDARARFVATELAALEAASRVREKVPGKPRATVDVLAKAAREYARDVIARLKVRDIKPGQYAAAAERSAAAAMKTRKDLAKAAEHKRNQLINTAAAKAANDALAEMKKAMAYFKSVQKAGVLPASYHEQIMALLDKFDLRVSRSNKAIDNTAKFRTWAKAQLDEGNVPPNFELLLSKQQRAAFEREILQRNADGELIYGTDEEQAVLLASYLDEAPVRNIKDATVEEVRGLRDTIKQIEHMGKRTKKVLTDRKNREFAEVVRSIKDRIVEVGERTGRKAGDTRTPNDTKGQEKLSWRGFFFSHIKAANITHVMDGGDGGPLWEHLIETANEAANNEAVDISKSHDAIQAMLAPLKEQGDITGKATYFPGLKRSLNRQAILVMALNLGNASNEQRLLGGEGWTREQIEPALATLTKADWTFVQKMWDHFESFRPRVGAMEREINGVEPEWIDARPLEVTTKDGEKLSLRGGYAPVVFDPRASGEAASQAAEKDAKALLQAARVANSVNKSFTKSRVQEVKGRPLKLSLDAMINAVQDTIHYLHWQPWVIDANRLVRAVDEPVRQYYGAEVTHLLRDWVADNAAGMRPARDAAERKVTALARNVSFAGLAFNFMSAAMQVTGYSQSVAVIGGKWMGRGMARMIAAPREAHAQAVEKSSFMAKRTTTRMRDMAEVNNSVQGQTALRGWTDRAGYGMMMAMQTMVDTPTWWGAYEKAIDAGRDEHDAVALADQAVKDSQGSGLHTDLASIERAQGAVRLLTGFMSFMNTTMNVNYRVLKSEQSTPAKIMDLLLVNVVPVILTIALKAALTPGDSGDDDAKKLGKKFGIEMFNFMMGQMVGTRELTQLAAAFAGEPSGDYGGPVGLRWVADSIKLAKQVGQGQMDDAFRKALVNAASDVLRLPGAQMNRTITGYEALKDGKTKNPAALVMGYQEPH